MNVRKMEVRSHVRSNPDWEIAGCKEVISETKGERRRGIKQGVANVNEIVVAYWSRGNSPNFRSNIRHQILSEEIN
jgi:hypothetical protein